MFEGPIRAADYAGSEELPILRQLRWTDLVARIAATRDCREAAHQEEAAQIHDTASFASFHLHEADAQRGVNRDALSDGKMPRLSQPDSANNAANGDRETK